jgi:hypothetical protein
MGSVLDSLKRTARVLPFLFLEGWEQTDLEWCPPGWVAHILEAAVKQRERGSARRHGLKDEREFRMASSF